MLYHSERQILCPIETSDLSMLKVLNNREAFRHGTRCYKECFSFNRIKTSSSVPLKGPGVSILIETNAAANFKDSLMS